MTTPRPTAVLMILSVGLLSACASTAPPPERATLTVAPPAIAVSASPAAPTAPVSAPTRPEVPSPSAYPDALRAAGLPVSVSGRSEELIGSGICGQVRAGRSDAAIASDLTATTWTLAQASTAVRLAHTVLHC